MAKRLSSILTGDMNTCFLTGSSYWVEIHHIFGGAYRKTSEKYGLVIPVTHDLHNEPPYGIHFNADLNLQIKQYAQRKFEEQYTREIFVLEFGKNYLYEDTDGYELNLKKFGINDESYMDHYQEDHWDEPYFNSDNWEAC